MAPSWDRPTKGAIRLHRALGRDHAQNVWNLTASGWGGGAYFNMGAPRRRPTRPQTQKTFDLIEKGLAVAERIELPALSGTMIRTLDGVITFWSPGMKRRYGFNPETALGRAPSDLLHTLFPRNLFEIEAELMANGNWTGAVINHHADGSPVLTAMRWDIISSDGGESDYVAETHSEVSQDATAAVRQFGDLVVSIVRELSEALLAVSNYNLATQFALKQNAPSEAVLQSAAARGADQIRRSAYAVHLLRSITKIMNTLD